MLKYITLFLLSIQLIGNCPVYSQVKVVKRLEMPFGFADDYPTVFAVKDHGVIIIESTKFKDRSMGDYFLTYFNQDLEKQWSNYYTVPQGYEWMGYDYRDNNFYLLAEKKSSKNLMRLDVFTEKFGKNRFYEFNAVTEMEYNEFFILDNHAILAGINKNRPLVLSYDYIHGKVKTLPGLYSKNSSILQISIDDEKYQNQGVLNVLISDKGKFNEGNEIIFKSFNAEGKVLRSTSIIPSKDRYLAQAMVASFKGKQFVAGTYSNFDSPYVMGVFVSVPNENNEVETIYTPLYELAHFFSFMKPARALKIKKKLSKRALEGKPNKYKFRLNLTDLRKSGNRILLSAEGYYPKTINTGSNNINAINYATIAYRYTHAIVLVIDESGRISWDAAINLDEEQKTQLNRQAFAAYNKDELVLIAPVEGDYLTKTYTDHGRTVGEDNIVPTVDVERKARGSDSYHQPKLLEWYDHYYLGHGVQRVKAPNKEGLIHTDKVFYLNKIEIK